MSLPERARCGGCRVLEGQIHEDGCDMERCTFCGWQRISCGCDLHHFYPAYSRDALFNPSIDAKDKELCAQAVGLPLEVYKNGLSDEQLTEWGSVENEKGRVPFILYPNICGRCGELWPEMFMVPDAEWEKYIEISERDKMLCAGCYGQIIRYVDEHETKTHIETMGELLKMRRKGDQ